MKIFLLLILSAITFNSFAQFNQTESEVMQLMSKDETWTFHKKDIAKDGSSYLSYLCNTPQAVSKTFYFDNNKCVFIRFTLKNETLNNNIKELNSKFSSQPNNTWIDRKDSVVYQVELYQGDPIFDIVLHPLQK